MEKLAQLVGQHILQQAEDNWIDCVDDDGRIIWDEDAAIYNALESLIETLCDELAGHSTIQTYLKAARMSVQEAAEDDRAYGTTTNDHMRYYGLSEKDFV